MTHDIIVVGNGITAMAAALAFRHKKIALITDKNYHPPPTTRYFALNKKSVDFLGEKQVDVPKNTVNSFQLNAPHKKMTLTQRAMCHIVAEDKLTLGLKKRIAQTAIDVIVSDTTTWQGTDADAIKLTVNQKQPQTLDAKLLVVAEGAKSSLGRQLKVTAHRQAYFQHALVARLSIPSLPDDTAIQWFSANETIALLPIGAGDFCIVWSAKHNDRDGDKTDLADKIKQRLKEQLQTDEIKIAPDSMAFFPLYSQQRALPTTARTAFVGDALQVVHPLAGQGLNLGIANCYLLAKCVQNRADVGGRPGLSAYARHANNKGEMIEWFNRCLAKSGWFSDIALTVGSNFWLKKLSVLVANR